MRRDADRVISLLRQRGIVDDQPGILASDHLVRFGQQCRFERRGVPDPAANEMMKLVVIHSRVTRCHRLHTLAIARADQPGNVSRTHPGPRLVPQPLNKRGQPGFQIASPVFHNRQPPSKLVPYESPKTHHENPQNALGTKNLPK